MGRFPHLDDTKFPDLQNVDVYRYRNNFDYSRWEANAKIRLVNVLFDTDYHNVVKFDSDIARDRYFDSLEGYAQTLTTAFQVAPNDTVKLPIPYGVMCKYNYMYIDLPMYTSEAQPIEYEGKRRIERYYYFVENVRQLAPSTSEVTVSLDQWTTYINTVDISFMMLERGHAPMKSVSVEDYLANPIANSRYLLAADYNYSNGSVVSDSRFIPFGSGRKYVLIASTASAGLLANFGEATDAQATSSAVYTDASGRDGHKMNVSGYAFGQGGLDFAGCALQTDPYAPQNDIVPNNVIVYAIEAESANAFFNAVVTRIPHFMRTVQGLFMLSDDLFETVNTYQFAGFALHTVKPLNGARADIKFDRGMFNFPTEYADIAKLYTFPYSYIEVTDNNGNAFDMRIEQCGNITLHQTVSLAFPYLKIQAFFTGANGEGYTEYTWVNLAGTDATRQMWGDDFSKFLIDWDIPVYACYMRGWDDYRLANWAQNQLARENAVTAYQNAARAANTGYANAVDSAETGYANAERSADTGKANADASADAGKSNADASADAGKSNADASANTSVTNTANSANTSVANTGLATAASVATVARSNQASTLITNIGNETSQAAQAYDAGLQRGVQEADAQAVAATTLTNAIGGLAGSVATGAMTAGVAGAATAAVGGVISGVTSGVNAAIMLNASSAKVELSIDNSQSKTTSQNNSNTSVNSASANAQTDNAATMTKASTQQTANSANTANTNAANSANTAKANATRTQSTAKANATRTQSTAKANATRTQSTAKANAAATRDNAEANAGHSRNTSVEIAQQGMTVAQRTATRNYQTRRNDAPIQRGSYSGDATLDLFERRGVQIKIRTQRESDIAQAGDMMLRFGYALNQTWNIEESGWQPMRHFAFWKARDVWVTCGAGVTAAVQYAIQGILERGVTVWSNPDEIGRVGIYGNL